MNIISQSPLNLWNVKSKQKRTRANGAYAFQDAKMNGAGAKLRRTSVQVGNRLILYGASHFFSYH